MENKEKELYEKLSGGSLPLQTVASLSKRWGISIQAVKSRMKDKRFPEPIVGLLDHSKRDIKLFSLKEIKEYEKKFTK